MKCECCDNVLTDIEARIRFTNSRMFANTCRHCLDTMDTPYRLSKPAYEPDVLAEPVMEEEVDPYSEDYWNER